MPIVKLPNGIELDFPEGTSKDVMRAAIQKKFPDMASPTREQLGLKPLGQREKEELAFVLGTADGTLENTLDKNQKEELAYVLGTNRTPVDTLRDLGAGALSGLGKGGQFIGEQIEKIPGFDKLQKTVQGATGISVPRVNMDKIFNNVFSQNKSLGGEITKGIGEYLPYGLAGGASLLGQLVAGAASGAALTDPNEKNFFDLLPRGKTGAAIEGAILNLLTGNVAKGLEALRPSKMFRGNLSSEELKKNLDITKGTETGLGDVIESPFLKKRLENTLTTMPFSGANESLQRTGKEVVSRGEDILAKLLGENSPENVPAQIAEDLISQFKKHQKNKIALYDDVNKIANDINLKLELPNFSQKAKDVTNAIKQMNLLKSEPEIEKIYKKLKNYKNPVKTETVTGAIVDEQGKPVLQKIDTTFPTLKEANILKGQLNHYAEIAGISPNPIDRNTANVYSDLSEYLKKDIYKSIKNANNPDLSVAYKKAEENYAKNFSPFLDKEIYKFVSGNADPETIVQKFIKTSPSQDLSNQLGKLADKLPPQSRNLLIYSYLSRALDKEGNLNPGKLSTAINKLGSNQFKKLVPDHNLRKQLLDYSKLSKMNQEVQNLMFNPNTGQRNRDAIVTALLSFLGHAASGNIAALGLPAAAIGAAKLSTKALTSETLRNNLINKMIKNKPLFNTSPNKIGTAALINALKNKNTDDGQFNDMQ